MWLGNICRTHLPLHHTSGCKSELDPDRFSEPLLPKGLCRSIALSERSGSRNLCCRKASVVPLPLLEPFCRKAVTIAGEERLLEPLLPKGLCCSIVGQKHLSGPLLPKGLCWFRRGTTLGTLCATTISAHSPGMSFPGGRLDPCLPLCPFAPLARQAIECQLASPRPGISHPMPNISRQNRCFVCHASYPCVSGVYTARLRMTWVLWTLGCEFPVCHRIAVKPASPMRCPDATHACS